MSQLQPKKRNTELILVGLIMCLPALFSNVFTYSDLISAMAKILSFVGVILIIIGIFSTKKNTDKKA